MLQCCQLSVGTGPDLKMSGLHSTAAAQRPRARCLQCLMQRGARPVLEYRLYLNQH